MLIKCLMWRKGFGVDQLLSETFPAGLAGAGQLSGRDRAGNPVTFNFYGGSAAEDMHVSAALGVSLQ